MRWIVFAIFAYLCLWLQTTLGYMLHIRTDWAGVIAPDFLAIFCVFIALAVREPADLAVACWVLGIALDLTAGGAGAETTVVGPMAIAFTIAGFATFKFRDAFYRDKASSQAMLVFVFCIIAHGIWVTVQLLIAWNGWAAYGQAAMQTLMLAFYSALLAPSLCFVLGKCQTWLLAGSAGRGGMKSR